jgi:RNA polymerase sigma factor (sigma-70 family)
METSINTTMAEKTNQNITQTVKEYGKRLWSFVRNKLSTNEDAEDILQDVWYQFSNLSNIDELESTSGWLYQVARNKVTDFYRKKRPAAIEDYSYENEDGEVNFLNILLTDDEDTPDMQLFKDLFWEELMEALDELPENQRYVFMENELEDKTLQQIADETGENLKTIISRKGYAVKHLRKRLAFLYDEISNN